MIWQFPPINVLSPIVIVFDLAKIDIELNPTLFPIIILDVGLLVRNLDCGYIFREYRYGDEIIRALSPILIRLPGNR
jgi:hypothetical protein